MTATLREQAMLGGEDVIVTPGTALFSREDRAFYEHGGRRLYRERWSNFPRNICCLRKEAPENAKKTRNNALFPRGLASAVAAAIGIFSRETSADPVDAATGSAERAQ